MIRYFHNASAVRSSPRARRYLAFAPDSVDRRIISIVPTKDASTQQLTLPRLLRHMLQHAAGTRQAHAGHPEAESIAQAAACAAPILATATAPTAKSLAWLAAQLNPWEQLALSRAQLLSTDYAALTTRPAQNHTPAKNDKNPQPRTCSHLFEPFLHRHSAQVRKSRGVYFTPEPVAHYLVSRIDALLHTEFKLPGGITTPSTTRHPKSAIPLFVDPACGTGVFLLALLDHAYRKVSRGDWNAFISDLLPRLIGIEILPPAAFLAKLNITLKLAETGYDFSTSARLQIHTADALAPETQAAVQNPQSAILPVVFGNPPFSSLSTTTHPWIAQLVRGNDTIRGYIQANGQRLGERKTWLHDDYVKFIRLAQWHVENAGRGLVGFVTNHGYLDNATFRLMRHELLRVFPRIEILDLHGNRKKYEQATDGLTDENVFGLDQGLAISWMCRPASTPPSTDATELPSFHHAELWGTRAEKLRRLATATHGPLSAGRALSPRAPDWRFVPTPVAQSHPDYASAWSLTDAMPVNTTAPVTARDHFVVAFSRQELTRRLEDFRNLAIPDDTIRDRYFQRTRSARYQTGDTRGWKLAEARRTIAADDHWQEKIVRCLYRPFDWRYVFWHPAMIDWPRTEVTNHLLEQSPICNLQSAISNLQSAISNLQSPLCLIARRQQLPGHPCTFFWISDGLALDGVIRSDNRGSESLFPLYLVQGEKHTANFASAFVDQCATSTQLSWQPLARGDLNTSFGPEDLLAYIYALFHCPTYRDRYANELRTNFPRILLPGSATHFKKLAHFGHELINLHLLRSAPPPIANPEHPIPNPLAFRAGGYVALKKWLQPKHRQQTDSEYARISAAIARTLELMTHIDPEFKQCHPDRAG